MTPWRQRCPQGHTSLQTRGDDRYYCQHCECEYRDGPFDAAETEFPVAGVERIETPDQAAVLKAVVEATRDGGAVPARDVDGRFRSIVAHLVNLRDRGLVETAPTTGVTRWRPTAAGRREVAGSADPDDGYELVADGGEDYDTMSDNEDATLPGDVNRLNGGDQRSYTGDPDDWTIDDPKVGPGVPLCVRRAGATGPMEREEIGENGVALRGHAADYECPECGNVIRLVTSAVETQHRCSECKQLRWFRVSEVDYAE